MVSIKLTNDFVKDVIKNGEAECGNCGSSKLSFSEGKGMIRCYECGAVRGRENFRDFIPTYRVLELENSKTISKNLRIPLFLYQCEDITINSGIKSALGLRKSDVTVLGDVEGETFFGEISDKKFRNPGDSIDCVDSVVKVSGSVYDVRAVNSKVVINGDVNFTLEVFDGSEVYVEGDCRKNAKVREGSELYVGGSVLGDVYCDDDCEVEVGGS